MDRDERPDALRDQRLELRAVVRDRGFVDHAFLRLDPRPLDREPIRVDAEVADQADVLEIERVAADRIADEVRALAEPALRQSAAVNTYQSVFGFMSSICVAALATPNRQLPLPASPTSGPIVP